MSYSDLPIQPGMRFGRLLSSIAGFTYGTILILRQRVCGLFQTHPLCQYKYSNERQQKLPFSEPTQQVLLLK